MNVTFVTGNQHKADKTAQLLGRELDHHKLDLDEIQTMDLAGLAEHKAKQAFGILKTPVIVDDYGLGFDALGGLPGPFIKFFVEADNGLEKLCRMLDPFNNRAASSTCVMAFYDGTTLKVFTSVMEGMVAEHPIGENGIHTDQIFMPSGFTVTRAQLDDAEYDNVYKRIRPLNQLKEFLDEYYG